jgi:hypothetical protein
MRLVWLAAALLVAVCVASGSAAAQAASHAVLAVVCSLDRPVIGRQQVVGAEVFADAPVGTSMQYLWKAGAGAFVPGTPRREAIDPKISWTPAGATPGTYKLTVRVTGPDGASGGCTLDVVVAEAARSGWRRRPGQRGGTRPAASVVVCEGASEVGLVRGLDLFRAANGQTPIGSLGVALMDCGGGDADRPFRRAGALQVLGYRTAVIRDDDKKPTESVERAFKNAGGEVVAWRNGRVSTPERKCISGPE